jgi:ribosome-associated protein
MPKLTLHGDHIPLSQAVKVAGLADTGGQAKLLIRDGRIFVNDVVEIRPGRKLVEGDRFRVQGGAEWIVSV